MTDDRKIIETLKELLNQGMAANQKILAAHLAEQGFVLNQSKISRLLRQIGAIKVSNAKGELVYALPKEPLPPSSQSALKQLVTDIQHNEHLIVLHTSPGAAQLIARILDYQREQIAILGTIAGDDTVFIAIQSGQSINSVMTQIKTLLAQSPAG